MFLMSHIMIILQLQNFLQTKVQSNCAYLIPNLLTNIDDIQTMLIKIKQLLKIK